MVDGELGEQLELPGCQAYAGLLLQLAVRGRLEVLARIEVAARQPPLLGVDARVLVALLEQDPAIPVDEDDPGEGVPIGCRHEGMLLDPPEERRGHQPGGRDEVDVGHGVRVDEDHLPPLVALHVAVVERRTRDEGVEVEGAAVVGDQLELPEVGELVGIEHHAGLLGQLAHGGGHRLLVTHESAAGEAPHLGPDRGVLVALLHEDPPARVDEGDLDEVGAHSRCLPLQHPVEGERCGLVELAVPEALRVDEDHLAPLAADHVVRTHAQAHGEQLELVVLTARPAAEALCAEGLEPLRGNDQARLLPQLAHRSRLEVLPGLQVAPGVAPPPGVLLRIVAAFLHQESTTRVDDGDHGESMHPTTLASPHIRTR